MRLVVDYTVEHASGRVDFRRIIPQRLRPFILDAQGKPRAVFKKSLGLKSAAGFGSRYEEAASEYQKIEALAQKKLANAYDALTPALINFLADSFLAFEVEADERGRWGLRGSRQASPQSYQARNDPEEDYRDSREMLETYDAQGLVNMWGDWATDFASSMGYALDRSDPAFSSLCRAIGETSCKRWLAIEKRDDGGHVETPTAPPRPSGGDKAPSGARVPLLSTFDAYAAAQGISPGVRYEWRRNIENLVKFLGHDDAARISADDLRRWRDQLLSVPIQNGKLRSPRTVRGKYMSAIRALLAWAVDEGKVPTNVASVVKVKVPRVPKLRGKDFTLEEARAILSASLEPASPRMSAGNILARRWVPWLCAYSGARVNEFSQLRGQDVQEIEGIWTIRITPEAGTVKTKEARLVPLHPHLIEQGFLDAVRAAGDGPIFYDPARQRKNEEGTRHFKKVGERLAQWVRKTVGITDPNVDPNHGWRHLFKTLCRSAGLGDGVTDAITGHAPGTVGASYGQFTLKAKADAMAKVPRFQAHAA